MSMQNISVSVIIPVFNNAATISRALDSVFDQSAQPNEIFIVDDASTDNSCAVIEKYIQDKPNAKLLRTATNCGPSATRNTGWAAASSDYIAFLDADDAWHSKKLETQFLFMQDNPEFVISGHQYQVMTKTEPTGPTEPTEPTENILSDEFEVSVFDFRDFLIRNRFSTPTVMLRKSVAERFDGAQRFSEDYRLWLRIIAAHKHGALIKLPMTYLYKPAYGAGGISGRMFAMYRGELANASALRKQEIIPLTTELIWRAWLTIKFAMRLTHRSPRNEIN